MDIHSFEIYKKEAIKKTRNYMRGYYEKRISPRDIEKDISRYGFSWIGASHGEWFPNGKEGIQYFKRMWDFQQVPVIHMDQDEYGVQLLDESTLLVCIKCRLTTDPSSGLVLAEIQRGTFIYRVEERGLRLCHIHVSNEWQVMKPHETFANTQGRANYEYLQRLVAQKRMGMVEKLSARQREVLNLLCQGHTYKEIGCVMAISPRTVRYHVNEMLTKFRLDNKNQLIAWISEQE